MRNILDTNSNKKSLNSYLEMKDRCLIFVGKSPAETVKIITVMCS